MTEWSNHSAQHPCHAWIALSKQNYSTVLTVALGSSPVASCFIGAGSIRAVVALRSSRHRPALVSCPLASCSLGAGYNRIVVAQLPFYA